MAPVHGATPAFSADAQTSEPSPDLLGTIRRLITEAQQRSEWHSDDRLKRSVAYLWAAADALEGLPSSMFE